MASVTPWARSAMSPVTASPTLPHGAFTRPGETLVVSAGPVCWVSHPAPQLWGRRQWSVVTCCHPAVEEGREPFP